MIRFGNCHRLEKMKTFGVDQEDILAAIQTILKDCERRINSAVSDE